MKLNHKFIDASGEGVGDKYFLRDGDVCIYCGYIINMEIEEMFDKLSKETEEQLTNDIDILYKSINENPNCISEDEYLIKKALE